MRDDVDDVPLIPDCVRLAANHVSVSARRRVSAEDFREALSDRAPSDDAANAVSAFLNEADPAEIADLVASGVSTFATLATLAKRVLPASHPNRVNLEQLAP